MKRLAPSTVFALALLSGSFALAQTTGSIRGVVIGPDSAPLPGVSIEATSTNLQGARTATSDREGRFILSLLPPGSYRVKAELAGFGSKIQSIPLGLAQDVNVQFELVPVASESVAVSATAEVVETTSNTVG